MNRLANLIEQYGGQGNKKMILRQFVKDLFHLKQDNTYKDLSDHQFFDLVLKMMDDFVEEVAPEQREHRRKTLDDFMEDYYGHILSRRFYK